ncbi:hypothetical protein GCM10027168_73330 [Streptomyces capparidis]
MPVTLKAHPGAIEVTVWDSNLALPIARAAEPGRVGQHGLEIVLRLSAGFAAQRESVNKRLNTTIPLAHHPDSDTADPGTTTPPIPM